MKKVIAMLLALVMVFALVACSSGSKKDETTAETTTAAAETTTAAAETTTAAAETTTAAAAAAGTVDYSVLKGKKIGCTIVYKGDEWCSALADNLASMGSDYGVSINVEDGDINDETQSKQIENMVANNVDMIFCDPATPDGSTEALTKAVDAGIPIIIYDGYWNEDKAVTTITWDQPSTGELIANYLIDYVNKNTDTYKNGEANIVVLDLKTSTHCMDRENKFKEVLAAKAPGLKIINTQDCNGNRETGANAITNIVEPFDFVASVVDNGAWGAISAIQARGLKNVKVLSMGAYGKEPFEALHNDDPNYLACVVVDPKGVAQGVYDAAAKYFKGETVDKLVNIDLYVADSSNVTDFWKF